MVKCSKGYKSQGNKCVRYITKNRYKDYNGNGKGNSIRNVQRFCLFLLLALGVLFAINLRNTDVLWALGMNIFFVGSSLIVYSIYRYQDDLIGIPNFISIGTLKMAGFGILFTAGFYLITLFVPGASIGVPILSADISQGMKWFLINVMSPISETLFFIGVVMGFFRDFFEKNKSSLKVKIIILTLASLLFSFAHLGAYIYQIYSYPEFTSTMSAFWANFSAFFTAFLFNMVAGGFTLSKYCRNLVFPIVFHFGLNFIATSLSVIVFAFIIPMI